MDTRSWWETVGAYNVAVFPLQAFVDFATMDLTYLVFARATLWNGAWDYIATL
jgi:hypothetical protein